CELRGDFYNRDGRLIDPNRLYLSTVVEMSGQPAEIVLPPVDEPGSWHKMEYGDHKEALARGRVYLGPPWQCLREIALEPGGCWGRIMAPPHRGLAGDRTGDGWIMPSVVLDGCFHAAGAFLFRVYETVQLPEAIARLRLGRLPRQGEACLVRARLLERQPEYAQFDFALYGEDGAGIAALDGFRFVLLSQNPNERS